jgi:hypothetical protein
LSRTLQEASFVEHGRKDRLGAPERAPETVEKPFEPASDVEISLLRRFENVLIGLALLPNLSGQAVEALRAALRTGKQSIRNGASDAAVAVLE